MAHSNRGVVDGLEHGAVGGPDEAVDVLAAPVPGGELGQQVDGAPDGLDEREVPRRQ